MSFRNGLPYITEIGGFHITKQGDYCYVDLDNGVVRVSIHEDAEDSTYYIHHYVQDYDIQNGTWSEVEESLEDGVELI